MGQRTLSNVSFYSSWKGGIPAFRYLDNKQFTDKSKCLHTIIFDGFCIDMKVDLILLIWFFQAISLRSLVIRELWHLPLWGEHYILLCNRGTDKIISWLNGIHNRDQV